jgi:outer membrane lipoprotein-sorting protein
MKKKVVALLMIISIVIMLGGCTEEMKSIEKDRKAEIEGLERKLTVYSSDGKKIKEYQGKFNIDEDEGKQKVKFILNGKRIIIYNGIVITEEVEKDE